MEKAVIGVNNAKTAFLVCTAFVVLLKNIRINEKFR